MINLKTKDGENQKENKFRKTQIKVKLSQKMKSNKK